MEKLIECGICLQCYSEKRRPRVLNCGHTFCHPCLKGLLMGGPPSCAICRSSIYYEKATYISYNYSLDSLVPEVKKHHGITCCPQQVRKPGRQVDAKAVRISMKKAIEAELRSNLENEFKGRIDKEIKEKLKVEKAKINKIRVKLEKEYKKKKEQNNKRMKNTQALMREEINKLKALRKQEKSEVRHLMYENKKLLSENKAVLQGNERECRYKKRYPR